MTLNPQQARVDHALGLIRDIDFSMVRAKLTDPDHGYGWSTERLELAEAQYRQFLALTYAYPDKVLIPSRLADEYWHAHILDTRAYAHDCQRLFGFFLHHFPYLGLRGEEDAHLLASHIAATQELAAIHFGQDDFDGADCGSCSGCATIDTRQFAS